MIKRIILASAIVLSCGCYCLIGFAQGDAATTGTTGEIILAAKKFFGTLDEAQRGKVLYDFKDNAQRKRWSNLPTTFVKRGGLRMGDLSKPQRDAAMALLAAALSPQGYEKVTEIVEGDEVLKQTDHRGPGGGGGPGGPAMFGHDEYYISLLGQPSTTDPWMIQFGGHHLGLNITLVGEKRTLAPSHTGSQPAIYELEGKTIRPLGREIDKSFALVSSLDDGERKEAILGFQMHDLVLGPGRDGQTIQPEGIKGSALTEAQRKMLVDLAGEWIGIMSEDVAKGKMDEMKQHIDDTWFAWSGPIEKGKGYFRIQGPTVFIEYAPQTLGGDVTKHIHTIYREPKNDYGANWVKQ